METNNTLLQTKPSKKKKSYRKKVQQEWTYEQTLKLIKELQVKRSLWDSTCAEYKLPKETVWKEVENAVGMPVNECKGKWANLRTTFNSNIDKLKKKKLSQGTNHNVSIAWKFFKPMLFLERSKVRQALGSCSSLELTTERVDDPDPLCELTSEQEQETTSFIPPTTNERKKRQRSSSPKTSSEEETQELQVPVRKQTKNPNILLGEYFASELDSLPKNQSFYVRSGLRNAFNLLMRQLPEAFPSGTLQPEAFNFEQCSGSKQFWYISEDGE